MRTLIDELRALPALGHCVAMVAILLLATTTSAVAADQIVGTVRENLAGGHDVVDLGGKVVLEGHPSLSGGELYRDLSSGRFEFETRPGLDGDTAIDLHSGPDE